MKVLVFPSGTGIGQEIIKSLRYCKDLKVFGCGQDRSNHSEFVLKDYFEVPSVFEQNWIEELNQIIKENKIDFILPAHDDIIWNLKVNESKINCNIVTSPLETVLIARSKKKTYEKLKNIIEVPEIYEDIDSIDKYPVFLKPECGQGSKDSFPIFNRKDLDQALSNRDDFIISEYLPGKEYTVDCFSDREKGILYCGGRERIRTQRGISVSSQFLDIPEFNDIAEKISSVLELHGAWFFQVKYNSQGKLSLLEVAPRIAGTMALSRSRSINFPLLSIFENQRKNIEIISNDYFPIIDRDTVNRYKINLEFDTVYVDFDDTIFLNKSDLNFQLLGLLYQFLNQGKQIILVTKHENPNLYQTLDKLRIKSLFDEIIWIKKSELKSDFIKSKSAIFIDDSFQERKEIKEKLNIPVFDQNAYEFLLDERI